MRRQIVVMAVIHLIMTACSDNATHTPLPAPFLPQQRDVRPDIMDALLIGELVLADNCLRVNHSNGESFLLIWPHGFSLGAKGRVIQVIDNAGRPVAQVGDRLEVGGGVMPAELVEEYTLQPVPSGCPGPYWIVGNQINK